MLREARRIHPEMADCFSELIIPRGLHAMVRSGIKFSGIYSIATLMHLPQEQIVETIQLLELLIEPGGIIFLSVCTERGEPKEEEERIFTLKPPKWWKKQLEKTSFRIVEMKLTPDGLKRELTSWLNITAVL